MDEIIELSKQINRDHDFKCWLEAKEPLEVCGQLLCTLNYHATDIYLEIFKKVLYYFESIYESDKLYSSNCGLAKELDLGEDIVAYPREFKIKGSGVKGYLKDQVRNSTNDELKSVVNNFLPNEPLLDWIPLFVVKYERLKKISHVTPTLYPPYTANSIQYVPSTWN